jgi:hypothetical protein
MAGLRTVTWGERIRTVLLVTLITAVVWLLAEARMIQSRSVELQLVLVGAPDDRESPLVVRPAPGTVWNPTVDVELEGSLASLDQAVRELHGTLELATGGEIPSSAGVHEIDLRAIVRDHPALRSHGVSVRSISNDTAVVDVDTIVEVEAPVRVDVASGIRLDGAPRAVPASVKVRGPSSVVSSAGALEAVARPAGAVVSSLTPGRLEIIPEVPVELPISGVSGGSSAGGAWALRVSPARVDVRLTLSATTQTTTIERLPVQVLLAPGEVGRWDIRINPGDEDLVSVLVAGPSDALGTIADGSASPIAVLALSFQELERGIRTKTPVIRGLPAGCVVRSTIPEIGFTITRRSEVGSGGAGDDGGGGP